MSDHMVNPSFAKLVLQPPGQETVCASNEGVSEGNLRDLGPSVLVNENSMFLHGPTLSAGAAPFVFSMNPDAIPFVPPTSSTPDPAVQNMLLADATAKEQHGLDSCSNKSTWNYCPSPVLTSSLWAQDESIAAPDPLATAPWKQHSGEHVLEPAVWRRPEEHLAETLVQPASELIKSEPAPVKEALPPGWEQTVSPDAVLNAMKAFFDKRD